jgi:transcriptional regulator with XRE-family HTH domain
MVFGKLSSIYLGTPNEFTKAIGDLVREARKDVGISQADLAELMMTRQATISDIENGKVEINLSQLLQLSQALEKPIDFFIPEWTIQRFKTDTLTPELQILIISAKKLSKEDVQKLTAQVKAIVNFSQKKVEFRED